MRWVVSCTPETRVISEKLFQGAVALDYFTISDDDRTATHALNTAITEIQTAVFSEDILLCCGHNACMILNTPHSPVRTILSLYFSKASSSSMKRAAAGMMHGSGGAASAMGPTTATSSPSNRLVTLSIASFTNNTLASGGTPLALKVAQGLGIVNPSDGQSHSAALSNFSNLNFGSRKSTGHVVQIRSAIEADTIVNSLFKSISFQRHLQGMTLCVRLSFCIYSDAPNDGDDFPHWVNEQMVTLWFVHDRHMNEYLSTFETSVKMGHPARFVVGYSRINTMESAALCADAAAYAWKIITYNDLLKPISQAGRPTGALQLGIGNNPPPGAALDLQATHNFAVTQRRRLLEETAAFLNSKKHIDNPNSHSTFVELQHSRGEVERLGVMYDEAEKKFSELANELELEREAFRVSEDEAKQIADSIERCTNSLKEEEDNRKEMLAKVVELTKKRDVMATTMAEIRASQTAFLQKRSVDNTNFQNVMISEAVQRQEEFDTQRTKLRTDENEDRRIQREKADELRAQLDQIKNEEFSEATISIKQEIEQKKTEIEQFKIRHKKLKTDSVEVEEQFQNLRSQLMTLNAEHNELTRRHPTAEHLETYVLGLKEELRRVTSVFDDLQQQHLTLEKRKSDLISKQTDLENACRAQVEEALVKQQQQSEEARVLVDEEMALVQHHEDVLRARIFSEFEDHLHAMSIDWWLRYNRLCVIARLKNAEDEREGLVLRVNEAKDEVSQLSYQSLQLDDDIERLGLEISVANKAKEEVKEKLAKSLSDIREERAQLTAALAGNGTESFPLLDAQRDLLEERFALLQRCIALPSLQTATTSTSADTTAASEPSVPSILTRQIIADELGGMSDRLQICLDQATNDNCHMVQSLASLDDKKAHLLEEETMRKSILKQLQSTDNELGVAIAAIKDDIHSMTNEVVSLQKQTTRRNHTAGASLDDEQWNYMEEERKLVRSIADAKHKLETLETQRGDNFKQMKMNESRINVLRQKQNEVWEVAKDISRLMANREELAINIQ